MYENYRVLFVDDELNILNSLRRGLMDEEYFCQFASSGKEALEIITKDKIAVIVTDMRMPEMNGLELLNIVAEESPMTVNVVLSGYTQLPQILVTVNQIDVFKFITKPWQLGELIQIVRKSLDYYIIREENANYKNVLEAKNKSYQNILKKINEVVDDAKKSMELLGFCGKALVGFGKNFNPEERVRFQSIFSIQEKLFDFLSQSITAQKKEMKTVDIINHISNYISKLFPGGTVQKENDIQGSVNVNLKMLETAINSLWIAFSDEFHQYGLYAKLQGSENFTLTIISPDADSKNLQKPGKRSLIDVKIELMRAVLEKVLESCQIKFQITSIKGNLFIGLTLLDHEEPEKFEGVLS